MILRYTFSLKLEVWALCNFETNHVNHMAVTQNEKCWFM